MAERRTLYSGYSTSEVTDPRDGDLFVTNDGTVFYYVYGTWGGFPAGNLNTSRWLSEAYKTLPEADLHEVRSRLLTMTDEMHDALTLFASYLLDNNDASEVKKDFQLYRAQQKLQNANS
jgi:hypothetical protein